MERRENTSEIMSSEQNQPSKFRIRDLESNKGKLFDFNQGKLITESTITNKKQDNILSNAPTSVWSKNAGPKWFNMETPQVTPEIERDLRMIRLRAYMDPKQFFKKDDFASKKLPEHFQIGTVIAGLGEKSLKRKERYNTVTEEILANTKVRKYAKRVFEEVEGKSKSGGKKSYQRKRNQMAGKYNKKRLI